MNLKEFSRKLGLSQTTVSRALSGYPEVKTETRERVAEAALKFGYHPNRAAIGLATGRAGAIGIVFRGGSEFGPHTSEFMGGLGTRLEHESIDILLSTVDSTEAELQTYRRLAASKRVDAVILHSPTIEDERVAILNQLGLPFVMHGRTKSTLPYHFMDIDNFGAIHRATTYLIELGHKRIAFINGLKGRSFAEDRDQGYRLAHSEANIAIDPALLGSGEFTDDMGFQMMSQFLNLPQRPTAVLAGSMMSALGAMRAVRTSGLQLGKDVSLIAHDDVFPYISGDHMVPTVSVTRSSMRAAGVRIGEMLQDIVSGRKTGWFNDVWPVELVLRDSTGPAPKS
ncbi:MAG: substrate-binding domain-containing protein [Rhizobiaceae bacterium]